MEEQRTGLITEMFGWLQHPLYSECSVLDWLGGFVIILLMSFLWSTVVKEID